MKTDWYLLQKNENAKDKKENKSITKKVCTMCNYTRLFPRIEYWAVLFYSEFWKTHLKQYIFEICWQISTVSSLGLTFPTILEKTFECVLWTECKKLTWSSCQLLLITGRQQHPFSLETDGISDSLLMWLTLVHLSTSVCRYAMTGRGHLTLCTLMPPPEQNDREKTKTKLTDSP